MSTQINPNLDTEIDTTDFSAPRPPSLEQLLDHWEAGDLIEQHGRAMVVAALREELAPAPAAAADDDGFWSEEALLARAADRLRQAAEPSLRRVFNLTGSVLHSDFGRAQLPEEAVQAMTLAAMEPCNLDFDLARGERGDRDQLVEGLVRELTGAEAVTLVNNNAAALLLALNTLALRKEVIVARSELGEAGGAFRIPEMMTRAGCKLREIGSASRTHLKEFEEALSKRTGLLLKVHTGHPRGSTASVAEEKLATLARAHGLPFMVNLGGGTLVDLARWGLAHEPTVQESLSRGADLVTFSGDKLLGGPQAGIIVGRADLIARIRKNPLHRALRVDKMTLAALEAVLQLHRNPDRLQARLPALRLLTRGNDEIEAVGEAILPMVAAQLEGIAAVTLEPCASRIGSDVLALDRLASTALVVRPLQKGRRAGAALQGLEQAFRDLPLPVIGRVDDQALSFDLRCLEDVESFISQLPFLALEQG